MAFPLPVSRSLFVALCCFDVLFQQAIALAKIAQPSLELRDSLRSVRPSTFDESGVGTPIVVRGLQRDQTNKLIRMLTPDECQAGPAPEELSRPIAQVMREHSDKDGYCYFGLNPLMSFCYVSRKWKSMRDYQKICDYTIRIRSEDPVRTIKYDGGTIRTRNHVFPYDDMYCHANGFFDLPRSKITDFDWWETTSINKCDALEKEFGQDFGNYSWVDLKDITDGEAHRLDVAFDNLPNRMQDFPTAREMRLHAAAKCALARKGLSCDMAYCAGFGCMLDDGYVGHGDECPAMPSPVDAFPPADGTAAHALGVTIADIVRAAKYQVIGTV